MSNSITPAATEIIFTAETTLPAEGITATEVINATEAPVIAGETTVLAAEVVTDAELIAAAKDLNASAQSFLRKGVEEFWKLGEALTRLQERPSVKGRWREVLKDIGLNPTSANHAQRFHAAITLEKLAGYRNKTAALRALGILSEATPAKKETADRSSKAAAKATPAEATVTESAPVVVTPTDTLVNESTSSPDFAATPAGENNVGGRVEGIGVEAGIGEGAVDEPRPEPIPAELTVDPLIRITGIADGLEVLISHEFDLTAEFVAQIERAKKSLALLLGKGAYHAAA